MEDPSKIPDIDYQPPQPQPEASVSGKKVAIGCGAGCLVLLIILVIAGFFVVKFFSAKMEEITEEQPIVLEVPVADDATIQALIGRYDEFLVAMATGKEAEPLILSGEEINLLIYNHPDFGWLDGIGRAAIEEDRFTATISVPLEAFGIGLPDALVGRHLNGEATLRFFLNQGNLEVYLVDLQGGGQSVPEFVMSQIRRENMMRDARPDPKFDAMIRSLEDLKVEDGKLWIVPKKPAGRPGLKP